MAISCGKIVSSVPIRKTLFPYSGRFCSMHGTLEALVLMTTLLICKCSEGLLMSIVQNGHNWGASQGRGVRPSNRRPPHNNDDDNSISYNATAISRTVTAASVIRAPGTTAFSATAPTAFGTAAAAATTRVLFSDQLVVSSELLQLAVIVASSLVPGACDWRGT